MILAIALLWFAVTDRLSRLLDAFDVATGKATVSATNASGAAATVGAALGNVAPAIKLPSLPALGNINHVDV